MVETTQQYEAVKHGVGLLDYSSRGKIQVTGPDRVSFLQAMISNDVAALEDGQGCYATFLTPRGKMVADFHVYRLLHEVMLDVETSLLKQTMDSLVRFIVMDDVTLEDVSSHWGHLSLQGPESEKVLNSFPRVETPPPGELRIVALSESKGWLVRKADLGPVGFELILPKTACPQWKQTLLQTGSTVEISHEIRDVLRLERAIPWFGVDMDQGNYPMEARLKQAISFSKGCYVGQEVVAKATYVGGVSRLLMGLTVEGERIPEKGTPVVDDDGLKVGHVTSAVFSPALRRPIAFGYLKKAFARPGERHRLSFPDGTSTAVEVVESFLQSAAQ